MRELQDYFQHDYLNDKDRIKEVDFVVNDVLQTLLIYESNVGWPYNLENNAEVKFPEYVSASTTTMIFYLVAKIINKISPESPLAPFIHWEFEPQKKEIYPKLQKLLKEITTLLINKVDNMGSSNYLFNSKTFGDDDPLTFSWYAEFLYSFYDNAESKDENLKKIQNDFDSRADTLVKNIFKNPRNYRLTWDNNEEKNISINHIFPILRGIHLFKTIQNKRGFDIDNFLEKDLENNLFERIYKQLSLHQVSSNMFDTAELVLSLEGLLLLDNSLKKTNKDLIKKIFDVIRDNQKSNLYWRPLQPFVSNHRGFILLPLSIEVANSLLRICKYLQKNNYQFFNEYNKIFHQYTEWLYSRKVVCKPKDREEVSGWHSEHVSNENIIHPWETAQAIIYLLNYKSLLSDQISHYLFSKSYLSVKLDFINKNGIVNSQYWKDNWEKTEPLLKLEESSLYRVYNKIRHLYIEPFEKGSLAKKHFSMLLFGPPGTGKSSIAEELAKSLNWRLITITPSDFIHSGESNIEANAKNIFKVLEEQKECVVLFDELDRMIFDRDNPDYSKQAEMFQFLTPSMLVKIKDLRSRKRLIFIIATNYEERIDSAIKRIGRIDMKFFISLPDLEQRDRIIKERIKKEYDIKESFSDSNGFLQIVKDTVLFNYGDLSVLVKSINNKTELNNTNIVKELKDALRNHEGSMIQLEAYINRFSSELKKHQMPIEEFVILVYLKHESNRLSQKDRDSIKEVKKVLGKDFALEEYIKDDFILKLIEKTWRSC